MPKMIISVDGVVIGQVALAKERTTLGRRAYNDIVIDNLAVSGEHAVLQMVGSDVFIEDLNSTNGTYINGKAVKKQLLAHNDTVEIGKYKIKFLVEDGVDYEKTMIMKPGGGMPGMPGQPVIANADRPTFSHTMPAGGNSGFGGLASSPGSAAIKVLNGAAAGREVMLTKVVTTVGKPGVQVASITKRPGGYVLAHVEGSLKPTVNGSQLAGDSAQLRNGDVIELAGTQMQFIQL